MEERGMFKSMSCLDPAGRDGRDGGDSVTSAPDREAGYRFRALGLSRVRHVAVDYRGNTANLYFRTSGKITGNAHADPRE
jgi:Aromatic prenyltransferase Orf2